ncbi:peptidyl-prolyl cis-trans isomerase B (cyclophilin B) [Amycolatopsis pretoriensis]|uniref:Peptidyl-prolyl cis-trans isomerase B (Cyclophilin B) n=1 Tax=Amycolatopsis pretoriensis TaxID=218821 RepID=A0A1H5QJ79_9PSEU|nr:peptidylprolyl isomerase [Amycolatopsis pretoriensis]SEF25247.1 peptidyl-prolyl cis-trans isomerase B (cyclophilin B) [Amycolatopsis pretoriensis]
MSEPGDRPGGDGPNGAPPPGPGYGGAPHYPQQPHQQGFQYPRWQPPVPPKKTSPAAVVLISGSVVVVVVMALAFLAWGYPGFLRDDDVKSAIGTGPPPSPPSTTTTAPSAAYTLPSNGRARMPQRPKPLADPVTCAFTPDPASPAPKKVAPPPDGPAPSSGTVPVRLATSAGAIGLTLDRALAPCTVVNFLSLVKQGFYDGTSCHRLSVTSGLQMLQCGDPVGDGTGGPGYTIRDEVFPELTYGRGILAMAKSAEPDSGGSQFFLVFGDTRISPEYTVFGSIDDAGLGVLDDVARGGIDPAKPGIGDGSGPPKVPVTCTQVTTP